MGTYMKEKKKKEEADSTIDSSREKSIARTNKGYLRRILIKD